ncbi:MAG: FAD-binding oxidoreductase [Gammaproteobacteria bacterium]|nr:FAD-binding oxidoreductase [Gammaproteobacteria bacterium]
MSSSGYIDSYYAATANAAPRHPRFEGDAECDVCVIGGGITGLGAALTLAERGYRVILIEAERIGWGASGRSGGQIMSGFATEAPALTRLVGLPHAQRLFALTREAVADVRARIARHGIACDWRDGQVLAAIKPRHVRELVQHKRLLERDFEYPDLRFVTGTGVGEYVTSALYRAALYDPAGGHLHPLNYTLGLAAAASAAGVAIHESSPAASLVRGARPVVKLAGGEIRARNVVLAGNVYLRELVPVLRRRIMPVGTYIIATAPLGGARARTIIPGDACVADMNFVLDYYRRSADDRLLFGGRVSYSTLPPPGIKDSLRKRMLHVFPALADVAVDYAWGGFVDITMNRAPDLGRLDGTLYYAQGFSGQGMALGAFAGSVLGEAIAGTAERLDLFAKIRHHDFPGGRALRMPLLVLAMLYYRLRDWL